MRVKVVDWHLKEVGDIELPEEIFNYPYKPHLIHQVVRAYLDKLRRGTHSTKRRGEVRGSGRKPWRQKGTGRARVGSIRTPLWRKGGTVHGPKPRSYEKNVTVREKKNALKSALAQRLREENLIIMESLEIDSYKTKLLDKRLKEVGLEGKLLLVDSSENRNLFLAARNNPRVEARETLKLHTYDVVKLPKLIISKDAVRKLVEVLVK